MYSLTKEEIERIRHVNEMKRIANSSEHYKLCYFPGANLVLLQRFGSKWIVRDETGVWYESMFDTEEVQ
jgi:hypothetical protein